MTYLQYGCHFCKKREVVVNHMGYGSCKPCQKTMKDHSQCHSDCEKKKTDESKAAPSKKEVIRLEEATNFQDIPLKEKPAHSPDMKYKCPKCKGHGYWNIQVDAYRKGQHFKSMCQRCNGWGWLTKADIDCDHKWGPAENLGRCYNEYTCEKCPAKMVVDSSD